MTTHDGKLLGPNPYIVKTISVGVTRDVRIGHEDDEGDSVWLSAQQFLSLLDWGAENRVQIERMTREREMIDKRLKTQIKDSR